MASPWSQKVCISTNNYCTVNKRMISLLSEIQTLLYFVCRNVNSYLLLIYSFFFKLTFPVLSYTSYTKTVLRKNKLYFCHHEAKYVAKILEQTFRNACMQKNFCDDYCIF